MITESVMSILFNRCDSLQIDPITSTFARSFISSSQRCLLHPFQVVFVFPPSHPYFFKDADFLIKYPFYSCEVSIVSVNVSYPVILMKILTVRQVYHSSFFSSPVDSMQAFGVDHIPF